MITAPNDMKENRINKPPSIAVICHSNLRRPQAKEFCRQQDLPLLNSKTVDYDLQLIYHDDLVELYDAQLNTSISVDFLKGALAHRQQFGGGRGQAIARAIGLKSGKTPSVIDATAGLAGDAFILANLGCPVTMIERSPILYTLIADALQRAALSDSFRNISETGFDIIHADANDYLKSAEKTADVIYIDPMFPERKKSALVKKDMQILQKLHGQQDDAETLLENALLSAKKRVVVKRPIHAATLSQRKPNTSIKSKKTRYDIYTIEKM